MIIHLHLILFLCCLASRRGIHLTSRSRPLNPSDLKAFDLFVAMDANNVGEMRTAIRHWSEKDASLMKAMDKIVLMSDYCSDPESRSRGEVPDPYYGGEKGFDLVLDLLNDACDGLLNQLLEKQPSH